MATIYVGIASPVSAVCQHIILFFSIPQLSISFKKYVSVTERKISSENLHDENRLGNGADIPGSV